MGAGAGGRGGGWARGRVGVGASEASAETVAPTFHHTRRERSERRDGSAHLRPDPRPTYTNFTFRPRSSSELHNKKVTKLPFSMIFHFSPRRYKYRCCGSCGCVFFFRGPPAGYPGQTTLDPGPWPPVTVDLGRRSTKILTSEGAPLSFFPPSSNFQKIKKIKIFS